MTFLEELIGLMVKHGVNLGYQERIYVHKDGDEEIVGEDWLFFKEGCDGYLDMKTISEAYDDENP